MDLEVWQKSMDLVVVCYDMVRQFPSNEQYGLASQVKRSAVSIPSNIAEGHARHHTQEYLHYLSYARGSLAELSTQLQIAGRLKFLTPSNMEDAETRIEEVGKMLNGLRKSLIRTSSQPPNPNPQPLAPNPYT